MSNSANEKALRLLQVTAELVKRANAQREQHEKQAAAVAARIPTVMKALLDHGRIFAAQKEAVASDLRDPLAALDLLAELASHRNANEVAAVGSTFNKVAAEAPVPAKTVRYIGQSVNNWDETEAGQRFRQRILGR